MGASRRVLLGIIILLAIIAIGVAGYRLIEGWSLFDSLYMTVTTITTVGFQEVHPQTTAGRAFTIFLIIGGVGGALYALTGIIAYVVEGQFGLTLGRQRMRSRIAQLKGHFILCGYGRVGEEIARHFKEEGISFVVIDNHPDCIRRLEEAGHLYVDGDATRDDVLKAAGVEDARGLVAAVGTDVGNTYITLSARGLNPRLFIEARSSNAEAEEKLRRAGADRVVSPTSIGGRRMAMLALRPAVVDFIDTVMGRGREMQLEDVDITPGSRLTGRKVADARRGGDMNILAMWRKDGRFIANPGDDTILEEGDRLVVIGSPRALASMEES